ncbi:MAG: 3-dehydroquinate synthase [Coxiella sp. (in: Bacteria)]|nr:MAG: 3-dehydroquinate synthase [Coxiella sp. (in: g-proteobacteria)]
MMRQKITVKHSGGEYHIFIGDNLLNDKQIFNNHIVSTQVCIVTNQQVADLFLDKLITNFSDKQCDTVILPDGEQHKSFESFLQVIDFLCEKQHHRDTTLIALGGGVLGDMTGFAAACYHRGVAFIQVPTTLLAQVDASIGGKTAVNHSSGKNLIGAFHQPRAVVIDLVTLEKLPEREFKSGLAEIIKAALIKDADFFVWLESHIDQLLARDKEILETAIVRSCEIKRDVVMSDENEMGARALLNFGHTFGHAIENNLGYGEWTHGEAVALGMLMATDLSCRLGFIDDAVVTRIKGLLVHVGYPICLPQALSVEKLIETMGGDKKVYKGRLNLILLEQLGSAVIKDDVASDALKQVVSFYKS